MKVRPPSVGCPISPGSRWPVVAGVRGIPIVEGPSTRLKRVAIGPLRAAASFRCRPLRADLLGDGHRIERCELRDVLGQLRAESGSAIDGDAVEDSVRQLRPPAPATDLWSYRKEAFVRGRHEAVEADGLAERERTLPRSCWARGRGRRRPCRTGLMPLISSLPVELSRWVSFPPGSTIFPVGTRSGARRRAA